MRSITCGFVFMCVVGALALCALEYYKEIHIGWEWATAPFWGGFLTIIILMAVVGIRDNEGSE